MMELVIDELDTSFYNMLIQSDDEDLQVNNNETFKNESSKCSESDEEKTETEIIWTIEIIKSTKLDFYDTNYEINIDLINECKRCRSICGDVDSRIRRFVKVDPRVLQFVETSIH